jgi:transposase InsO family protein
MDGHEQKIWSYVVPRIEGHDIILGKAWMKHMKVIPIPHEDKMVFTQSGIEVLSDKARSKRADVQPVSIIAIHMMEQRNKKKKIPNGQIFRVSLEDIERALKGKTYPDPLTILPPQYHEFTDLFNPKAANTLPPHRPGIDHAIELLPGPDGKPQEPPYGPLYPMSPDELIVLKKFITDLQEQHFIRPSSSSAASPVLLVKKPGGGIRFCVDYRKLNEMTKKDRYPLPLIGETLERIGKAKWFTKVDVVGAFHRIRIKEGDEWKTAFRTRFGLFEWNVTPFGLTNAPSSFQRYVNKTLAPYLDDFASAYMDDTLIYTDGTLEEHREHVRKVLTALRKAGLYLDITKSEFEVTSTKYLGFIIKAGEGVSMDPEKVQTILNWQRPTTIRGVRGFLGFANFYRQFIRNYSDIAAPLTNLTRRDRPFKWNDDTEKAFELMKRMFTSAPILTQFDARRRTVIETDSSGWATGGVLLQYDDDGILRPCAFFSKKNSPAECNYKIHDKELLAVIRCLQEWESELMGCEEEFEIRTDHRNLRYFNQLRRLTERQMRWSDTLSRYRFMLKHVPGRLNAQADALSRRDQDMPHDADDERLKHREVILLPQLSDPQLEGKSALTRGHANGLRDLSSIKTLSASDYPIEVQLEHAVREDPTYELTRQAIRDGLTRFPKELKWKIDISECVLDESSLIRFRNRIWVPNHEPCRTRIMREAHDSPATGHPGKNAMYGIVARTYYWPNMTSDMSRYINNCEACGSSRVWKERRQGLLKPLPIPDRIWSEISMDFITGLPISSGCTNVLVITDRLSKGVVFIPMEKITTEATAEAFIQYYLPYHALPRAIVSDRGDQFVGHMWKRICTVLKIRRRLSTAWHPETDGSTERMNQEIEFFFRIFCDWDQGNWHSLCPLAQLVCNTRVSSVTGMSPFFMMHGYNFEPWDIPETVQAAVNPKTPIQKADNILAKIRDSTEAAKLAMAVAQEKYERHANVRREPAAQYKPGDMVWLDLRNISTLRESKKLDIRSSKYRVIERVGSHAYRLALPPGSKIHPVFHTMLLRRASTDPFPSQGTTPHHPSPVLVDGHEEYEVEGIRAERKSRTGDTEYLVKWKGWREETWEPGDALQDTAALDDWEHRPKDSSKQRRVRRRR